MELQSDAGDLYFDLQESYRDTIVAPQDDMWATFADRSKHHGILLNGKTAGCCSINDQREISFFHVQDPYLDRAEELLEEAAKRLDAVAAHPSTVDPLFLSASLTVGSGAIPRALMYRQLEEPVGESLKELRVATDADHAAAVEFADADAGLPRAFVDPYFADRIAKQELFVAERDGKIVGTGECRTDMRSKGNAHLGLVVGRHERGRGLGSRLMHRLVLECRDRKLTPLCSTEPTNHAARKLIHKAGFRARHRVFRIAFETGQVRD